MTRRVIRTRSGPPGAVTCTTRAGVLHVRLSGEVDLWLHRRLDEVLEAVRRHPGRVEVDLRWVTFFGADGVRMLLALQFARPPGVVTIVGTSEAVERTLQMCGISQDALPRPPRRP
jgi:anti-anti-sigma factor